MYVCPPRRQVKCSDLLDAALAMTGHAGAGAGAGAGDGDDDVISELHGLLERHALSAEGHAGPQEFVDVLADLVSMSICMRI